MKPLRSYFIDFKWQVFRRNIKHTFLIVLVIFFIGLIIIFQFSHQYLDMLPGDFIITILESMDLRPTTENYSALVEQYGFDDPIIIQFGRFLMDFFSGNWEKSYCSDCAHKHVDVLTILQARIPRMFDTIMLPITIGLVGGVFLGKRANKYRKTFLNKAIQGFTILGISIPIFFLGLILKYIFAIELGWFPVDGYKSMGYADPPFVTGSRIIDSLLSYEYYYITDYLYHLILPILCLSFSILVLITWQARHNLEKEPHEKSIISNTMITVVVFGLILTSYIFTDVIFELGGLGNLFLNSINMFEFDFFLFRGVLFIILIISILIILFSNIIFSIIKSLSVKQKNSFERNSSSIQDDRIEPEEDFLIISKLDQEEKNSKINSRRNIRKYLQHIYKNPLTLSGLILISILIVVASFPQLISGYSFEEVLVMYSGDWQNSGQEVLVLSLWGLQDALLFGLGAITIGILGGIVFGLISSTHRYLNRVIEAIMILIFIIPSLIIVFIIYSISFGSNAIPLDFIWIGVYIFFTDYIWLLMCIIGFLLIPFFTRIVANIPLNKTNFIISLKKLLIYIPLILGYTIIFYECIGFMGFTNGFAGIQLGTQVAQSSIIPPNTPWPTIWLGICITFIGFGFISLHYGLSNSFMDNLNSSRMA